MKRIKLFLKTYLTPDEQKIIFFLLLAGLTGIVIHFSSLDAENEGIDSLRTAVSEPTPIIYDINTVTVQELQTIPGIGAVRAKAIIDYREANKPIEAEDLINVRGIGEKTLEILLEYFGKTVVLDNLTATENGSLKQEIDSGIKPVSESARMNVNDASLDDLMKVRGVGEVRGRSILTFLEERGRIKNIDQLLEVRGIGPKTLESIKELFYADEQ